MVRLVVNAQEFGAAREGDRAVIRAHHEGIVTSASLIGNCPDIAAAWAMATTAPELGIGVSLALMGGRPVLPVEQVPTLVTKDGQMRERAAEFAVDWLKNEISPDDIEREMEAQIGRARQAGFAVDHLCTQGHLGFLPGVGQLMERLARRHQISGIRTWVEPPTLSWFTDPGRGLQAGVLSGLSWLTRKRLGPLRHGPRTWGYVESGRLDEVRIIEIIGRLAPGAHELLCHPQGALGAHATADSPEFRALTSPKVKSALHGRGIVLSRWRDLF